LYSLITWTGESTGSKIASFPYLLASKENQTVFDPECVPKGFVLSDPDHLHGSQIISLYNHWLRRQARKLSPFMVLKSPLHQGLDMSAKARGKRKMEYVEVNSEDEEEKSMGEKEDRSEGDPSDDEEDDFGEKVISAGVMKVGPPTGNVTSSSKQPPSKARDDPQVAGPSSVPSKGKSIKANGQKEVNQLVAQKKIAWSKQSQNIDAQADKPQDDRSKLEQSAKKAKSTKSTVEAKVKPGPAKASKDNRTRQSGGTAEEAPATDPSPVGNPTTTDNQRLTVWPRLSGGRNERHPVLKMNCHLSSRLVSLGGNHRNLLWKRIWLQYV
jgi:hypothetical protein